MVESAYLKTLLGDIGHSVHCMNTIAVSLSQLTPKTSPPKELNISWNPPDVLRSSVNARRFAIKSSIVYSVESLFEYLSKISKDSLWFDTDKDFNKTSSQDDSKAIRVREFLKGIPGIETHWLILTELLCHWRNKVVHAKSSSAKISKKSRRHIEIKATEIYENHHHFDVKISLENFDNNKFTLKDVTTLITMLIKCAKAVDYHYTTTANSKSKEAILEAIDSNPNFRAIMKQQKSEKRDRQALKWICLNYSFLNPKLVKDTINISKQNT